MSASARIHRTRRLPAIILALVLIAGTARGANWNDKNKLHEALNACDTNAIKTLLDGGVSPDSRDRMEYYIQFENPALKIIGLWNASALGRAPLCTCLPAARLLLKRGANVNARDKFGNTPLHMAVFSKDENFVPLYLEHGAGADTPNAEGRTPLHHIAMEGRVAHAQLLIARGARVNARDRYGCTPLNYAAEYGSFALAYWLIENGAAVDLHSAVILLRPDLLRKLLKAGAEVNERRGIERMTPLHRAIKLGLYDIVPILLDAGADMNALARHAHNEYTNVAPLHRAAENCLLTPMAKLLLDRGARVDMPDYFDQYIGGKTPLHYAAKAGCYDTVTLLLARGADPNAINNLKQTPADMAPQGYVRDLIQARTSRRYSGTGVITYPGGARYVGEMDQGSPRGKGVLHYPNGAVYQGTWIPRRDLAGRGYLHGESEITFPGGTRYRGLIYYGTRYSPRLFDAVKRNDAQKVRALIDRGEDPNVRDKDGWTPLFYALTGGNDALAELLIGRGARVNYWTQRMGSMLHYAAANGRLAMARFLLDHGAAVDEPRCHHCWQPLHHAIDRGYTELAVLLVERGAPLDQECSSYLFDGPPLSLAIYRNNTTLAKLLIQKGANVNETARWTYGRYAALNFANLEVTRALLENGANANIVDRVSEMPLFTAARGGEIEKAALLIDRGASVNGLREDGYSPLHVATEWGHLAMVRFLIERGADIGRRDANGATPMRYACGMSEKTLPLLEFYLSQGVSPDSADNGGLTALHKAWNLSHKHVQKLIAAGANVNARDRNGKTPLHHLTTQVAPLDTVIRNATAILAAGANINARDNNGNIPLHNVCGMTTENLHVITFLIKNGADTTAKNAAGYTPLAVAHDASNNKIFQFLWDYAKKNPAAK